MRFFILTLLFCNVANAFSLEKFNVSGETNYSQQKSKSLNTTINLDFKFNLYEPPHKKYGLYAGGIVSPDYDHFGKEMKVNVFTVVGIDF